MCFGRAHSRISTRADTRRFISSVLHPNVCQRPRKFCCNYTSIVLYTSTNACAGFISTMKNNFLFLFSNRSKTGFSFPHGATARERVSVWQARPRYGTSFSRQIGDSSLRDARENIISRPNHSFCFKTIFFYAIYKINWLYISVACVIKCRRVCFKCAQV